jgi:hypothetical protein
MSRRVWMTRDFTLECYDRLLTELAAAGFAFRRFVDGLPGKDARQIVLRHDVDRLPRRARAMARREAEAGVAATYFMRVKPHAFDRAVIHEIHKAGHEIGYHYESLADARGDRARAWDFFRRDLDRLRAIAPVSSIAMHGRPFGRFDSRELWTEYDYRALGVTCEAYLDVDWTRTRYFTDTGRAWNAGVNRRDHISRSSAAPPMVSTLALSAYLAREGGRNVVSTHPERWSGSLGGWLQVLVTDAAISALKRLAGTAQRREALDA